MTCLTPALAEACKARGIPYVGCCPSRAHAQAVMKRLEAANFEAMTAEGTGSFKKELADVLAELGGNEEGEEDPEPMEGDEGARKRKRAKAKGKATGKKKARRNKKGEAEGQEEAEEEEPIASDGEDGLEGFMA